MTSKSVGEVEAEAATVPEIAVIITAYNRAPLLPRAVASLRGQSLSGWEAVIVDDGSTDDTLPVARALADGDRRIRVITQPNAGLPGARNAGIAVASAGLVTFLDSDDEYREEHLWSRLAAIRDNPGVDLLHGGVEPVGGPDWVIDRNHPGRRIALADCFIGGTFVLTRKLWRALGGFRPPAYGDDYDFATRAMAAGFRVKRIAEPRTYVYHRETPDGMCNLLAASVDMGSDPAAAPR